jgi:hypothetical protein
MRLRPTLSGAKFSFLATLLSCVVVVGIGVGHVLESGEFPHWLTSSRGFAFTITLAILGGLLLGALLGRFVAHRSFPIADKIFELVRWGFCLALIIAGIVIYTSGVILPGFGSVAPFSTFAFAVAAWICPLKVSTAVRQGCNILALVVASFLLLVVAWNLVPGIVAVLLNLILLDFFTHRWDPFISSFD